MYITAILRKNVAGIDYNDNYEVDGEYHHHINYRF